MDNRNYDYSVERISNYTVDSAYIQDSIDVADDSKYYQNTVFWGLVDFWNNTEEFLDNVVVCGSKLLKIDKDGYFYKCNMLITDENNNIKRVITYTPQAYQVVKMKLGKYFDLIATETTDTYENTDIYSEYHPDKFNEFWGFNQDLEEAGNLYGYCTRSDTMWMSDMGIGRIGLHSGDENMYTGVRLQYHGEYVEVDEY